MHRPVSAAIAAFKTQKINEFLKTSGHYATATTNLNPITYPTDHTLGLKPNLDFFSTNSAPFANGN